MSKTAAFLLLAVAALPAFAWTPVPCSAAAGAAQINYRNSLRAKKSVPYPEPANEQAAVASFISQFPGRQSPDLNLIARGIGAGNFGIDVDRVEDWTPDRCSPDRGDTFFLFSVVDPQHGEVARGALYASGEVASVALMKDAPRDVGPLLSLKDAVAKLAARGVRARDPQYVATSGTIYCRMLNPCVAMRNERGIYLLRGSQFILLPLGSPIYRNPPSTEPYVSIGANAYVVGVPLK